mmetsp:Transcript_10077/g.15546  ORF Transcript_10077/g.15546 Transcript_10077/m.15546 type:complete len:123 (+) Transcript_10077:63-431(+)
MVHVAVQHIKKKHYNSIYLIDKTDHQQGFSRQKKAFAQSVFYYFLDYHPTIKNVSKGQQGQITAIIAQLVHHETVMCDYNIYIYDIFLKILLFPPPPPKRKKKLRVLLVLLLNFESGMHLHH